MDALEVCVLCLVLLDITGTGPGYFGVHRIFECTMVLKIRTPLSEGGGIAPRAPDSARSSPLLLPPTSSFGTKE
jgi:hypothetical protein